MKIGRRGWWILAAIVAAAIVVPRTLLRPRPIAVEAERIAAGPVEDVVTNSEAGTVRSRATARLGAERAGRVARILRREGSAVRRGTVLLQLDSTTAERSLEAAQRDHDALLAAREATHSAMILAEQDFERVRALRDQKVVSQSQMDEASYRLDSARAEWRAAEARVQSARSAVGLARDELSHLQVRAPFDGTITRRLVEIGESVVPGQPVLEIMDLERLYVSAPIDERDGGRLRPGLPTRVTIDTYPGELWEGRLARVAPMVEEIKEQDRTIEVEVDLPLVEGKPRPRPGMTADVALVLDRRDPVLRVPSTAVTDGRKVLVVERGRAVARDVATGIRNWQWTEVTSGLRPGETVVTSLDRAGLKSGAAVVVKAAAAPARRDSAQSAARAGAP